MSTSNVAMAWDSPSEFLATQMISLKAKRDITSLTTPGRRRLPSILRRHLRDREVMHTVVVQFETESLNQLPTCQVFR